MEARMSNQRIIFMGTPAFAVASLKALLAAGVEVAAVVTAPDKPAGRGRQMRMSAVKEAAMQHGLRVLQPERLRDPAFLAELDALAAALYVVVAFRMLPEAVWRKPAFGTINLHASLLPAYRGAAPINWAIINGEARTGATTFFIQETIDSGDILDTVEIDIGGEESAGELHDRLKQAGAELLVRTVRRILRGDRSSHPQQASVRELPLAPKLTPENCRIDWQRPASRVHDHIRGLSPMPGAWSMLLRAVGVAERCKILEARVEESHHDGAPAGTVRVNGDSLLVACEGGLIKVLELQPEGKKRMSAADFLRGAGDMRNARFE